VPHTAPHNASDLKKLHSRQSADDARAGLTRDEDPPHAHYQKPRARKPLWRGSAEVEKAERTSQKENQT
jgi:hypothetical protein